jgi:hypothetical protein
MKLSGARSFSLTVTQLPMLGSGANCWCNVLQ